MSRMLNYSAKRHLAQLCWCWAKIKSAMMLIRGVVMKTVHLQGHSLAAVHRFQTGDCQQLRSDFTSSFYFEEEFQ